MVARWQPDRVQLEPEGTLRSLREGDERSDRQDTDVAEREPAHAQREIQHRRIEPQQDRQVEQAGNCARDRPARAAADLRPPKQPIANPRLPPLAMDGEGQGRGGPFFPSSGETNVGGPVPSNFFMKSEDCARCHKDIYDQWNSSAHHFASFNNQWYRKSIEYMQDTIGTRPSKWCAGCHDHAVIFAGKFDTLNVLIVVTYRPSDMLLAKHPFLQIRPDLQARGLCRELQLEFLNEAEIGQYLALEFPGHRFPPEFPQLIHAKTEGSPLFMADLVRYLTSAAEQKRMSHGRGTRQPERSQPAAQRQPKCDGPWIRER